uniref:U3 small nucleolar RNA-interacting protein 2 n=1 Tax=Lepeophtheirus salmonis TaxID=72036 RepID=C1BV17_LEPSM|nr:U3 small nucleolar RNA-interacting protein 2 [Lepeophtheirus salmonis]
MTFFMKKGSRPGAKKRKLNGAPESSKKKGFEENEEILSDDSDVMGHDSDIESHTDEDDEETSDQKRIRLAKMYLEEIEREEKERGVEDEIRDSVNERLMTDALEEKGKLFRAVASSLRPIFPSESRKLKDKLHNGSITSIACSNDHIYTASKNGGLIQWRLKDLSKIKKIVPGRKKDLKTHVGHCGTIHALAVSTDGKYLASGGEHDNIHIWDGNTMEHLHTFKGHRDMISGLVFRVNSHTLFSCSFDRSVKVWNLDEMTYIESLFGHQDKITGIDAGRRERAVTSGGRDGSIRVWKIVEESQLVFNRPSSSTDSVKLINEEHFVTCGEDGHISLWGVMRKKPLFTYQKAHGLDSINQQPMWISSIATLPQSDLIASGSRDGFIRLWRCTANFRGLKEIQAIPVTGFVNALQFSPDGKTLLAGIGQEHRLGRWWRIKEARNSILVLPLNFNEEEEEEEDINEENNVHDSEMRSV